MNTLLETEQDRARQGKTGQPACGRRACKRGGSPFPTILSHKKCTQTLWESECQLGQKKTTTTRHEISKKHRAPKRRNNRSSYAFICIGSNTLNVSGVIVSSGVVFCVCTGGAYASCRISCLHEDCICWAPFLCLSRFSRARLLKNFLQTSLVCAPRARA